jgi:contactin associated protein-like 2
MGHIGDIYFEFKTTVDNAVLLHSKGPTDFIKLTIIGKYLATHISKLQT